MKPLCLMLLFLAAQATFAQTPSRDEALHAMKRAATFFDGTVSTKGGYLWRYSADLQSREGEGKASATESWVQPPGTPAVAQVFLHAHEATSDPFYLDAATRSAHALVRGQLQSGGWDYRLEEDPEQRAKYAFRVYGDDKGKNVSTLDDDTTQSALRFLMGVDKALDQKDAAIHEAVVYALDQLIAVQYPNGAWPQRFVKPLDPAEHPVLKASYPESWPREYIGQSYTTYYTLNDGTLSDTIESMMLAYEIYGDDRYRASALKGGEFILLAQMPDPQPGWAQQYDAAMHPAWARKFEPPSITGGESQGIMRTLIHIARETGESRFLEPIPRALAYYRSSLLPDGRLARFYELQSNKPLYFTTDYVLTYSSDDMPTHYAFIVPSGLDAIENAYNTAKAELEGGSATQSSPPAADAAAIDEVIDALDDRGAWVTSGKLRYHGDDDPTTEVIDSRDFIENMGLLTRYVQDAK